MVGRVEDLVLQWSEVEGGGGIQQGGQKMEEVDRVRIEGGGSRRSGERQRKRLMKWKLESGGGRWKSGQRVEVEGKVEEEVRRSAKRGLEEDGTYCEVDTEGALNVDNGQNPRRHVVLIEIQCVYKYLSQMAEVIQIFFVVVFYSIFGIYQYWSHYSGTTRGFPAEFRFAKTPRHRGETNCITAYFAKPTYVSPELPISSN